MSFAPALSVVQWWIRFAIVFLIILSNATESTSFNKTFFEMFVIKEKISFEADFIIFSLISN